MKIRRFCLFCRSMVRLLVSFMYVYESFGMSRTCHGFPFPIHKILVNSAHIPDTRCVKKLGDFSNFAGNVHTFEYRILLLLCNTCSEHIFTVSGT